MLREAAATAGRSGDFTSESAALHDLTRLGEAALAAPRLDQLGKLVEGPLAGARAAHAAALVADDPVALEAASRASKTSVPRSLPPSPPATPVVRGGRRLMSDGRERPFAGRAGWRHGAKAQSLPGFD
jgi:hypothetical protein